MNGTDKSNVPNVNEGKFKKQVCLVGHDFSLDTRNNIFCSPPPLLGPSASTITNQDNDNSLIKLFIRLVEVSDICGILSIKTEATQHHLNTDFIIVKMNRATGRG